ncbi:hypothetical protein B0J12DRAFT_448962 [Macrophomina phaseolina]|uniref:PSI domain-containing protein n=1 Tax=Macrophomina phaseolina TaxID=35725 RepID=A0ABQ8GF54_9PEZI|nr:hypothetical protein B0J12DRAFT_448962 [Macrophomina phaseolina]
MASTNQPPHSALLETWLNATLSCPSRRECNSKSNHHHDPSADDRLYACWRLQTCGSCLSSSARCGWCPYSSTCVPLPPLSSTPLRLAPLAPLAHPHICPFAPERWELRTKSFGRESCNVSTTTALTAVVAFLVGAAAVFVVLALVGVVVWVMRAGRRARNGVQVVVVEGNGAGEAWREEEVWVRKGRGRGRRRWFGVRKVNGDGEDGERSALLGGGGGGNGRRN